MLLLTGTEGGQLGGHITTPLEQLRQLTNLQGGSMGQGKKGAGYHDALLS